MWRPMRSKIRPPPDNAGGRWSGHRRVQHLVEHLGRELPRERVLLAGVETSDQAIPADRRLGAVAEARLRARGRVPEGRERPQGTVPRERAEREDRPELA